MRTLAERGSGFPGSDETAGFPKNGNFLGPLDLIAKFDPLLANHLEQHGSCVRGRPSYLSKTICDELIILMAGNVREAILNIVRSAGYFNISVDSTTDLSDVD